jgi:hypothetical protein
MNRTPEFKLSGQLDPALSDSATRTLHADKLIGRWLNTNQETQGVAEIIIELVGEHFFVSVLGVGEDGLIAWPRTRGSVVIRQNRVACSFSHFIETLAPDKGCSEAPLSGSLKL